MIALKYIVICFLGLLFGYFINAGIAWAIKGERKSNPPSQITFHNPSGNHGKIRPLYLWQEYSLQLFIFTEITAFIVFIAAYHQYGCSLQGGSTVLLLGSLVMASFIDLKTMIIPDALNGLIGMTGILFIVLGWTVSFVDGFFGMLIGGGTLWFIGRLSWWLLKKEGMGGGDVKLAAACGLYLGADKMLFAFILTSYLAAVILSVLFGLKKIKKKEYLPFGPFLATGIAGAALFYPDFMRWYGSLFAG